MSGLVIPGGYYITAYKYEFCSDLYDYGVCASNWMLNATNLPLNTMKPGYKVITIPSS